MARPLIEIEKQLDDAQAAQPELITLDSPSQTAIYGLWKYITALCVYLLEIIVDTKQQEIETTVSQSYVPSDAWLQSKIFEFQYDASVPQIIQLVNFIPTYNPIDVTKRIITRASVLTSGQRIVMVKVAKNEPPEALTPTELSSLVGYLTQGGDGTLAGGGTGIAYAGVQIKASTGASDKLYLKAVINYNGQYASTIQANVIAAIDNYLATLPFNGQVNVLRLIDAIQNVIGVSDIKIEDLAIRADSTSTRSYMIQSFTQISTGAPTYAGYVVGETTAGETFLDQLTFVAS